MGSGKSTIGKEYAKKFEKTYVDTDDHIEKTQQQKISEIFESGGEEKFRIFETEALKQVFSYEVVSTGGGIVENIENLHVMKKNGIIIYLHTSFAEISKRLENDQSRPLWNNNIEGKINLYKRRIPLYRKFADYIIDTNEKEVDQIIGEIKRCIEE